jgi:type IV pilus assembly protein PilE
VTVRPVRRATGPRGRTGSTLVELSVVVVVTGILASMAVPSFRRALEQARVDQAAANLRTIWAAQRFYRLEHGVYAPTIEALYLADLIPLELAHLEADELGEPRAENSSAFVYEIGGQDLSAGFIATATRRYSPMWGGGLQLDETGDFDPASEISGVEADGTVFHIQAPNYMRSIH